MNLVNAILEGVIGAIISALLTYIMVYFYNKRRLSKYIGCFISSDNETQVTIERYESNTMKVYGTALHKKGPTFEKVEFESFIVLEFGGGTAVGNYRWKQLTWDEKIHDQGIIRIFYVDSNNIEIIFTNLSWRPNSDKDLYYSSQLNKISKKNSLSKFIERAPAAPTYSAGG